MKRILIIISFIRMMVLPANAEVKEYFITCEPDSFQYICDHAKDDIWISATLTYANQTWTRVRLRIRGDSSRNFSKKSFKIRFDDAVFVNGRDVLNFNAEYLDKSYMNTILASRMMRESGQKCFDAEPARLYLNNEFLGLYIRIENMDDEFLKANQMNSKGNLYKATLDGACLSLYDDVWHHWEKKTNKNSSRKDLELLIEQLNETADSDFFQMIRNEFEYDALVNIFAMNMLLANGSTYYHNYYMYHDEKWLMLPWDMDRTFHMYGVYLSHQKSSNLWSPDNPLLERSLLCPPIFKDIRSRIDELHETIFNSGFVDNIIDNLQAELTASILQDTEDAVSDLDEWANYVERNKDFVKRRYSKLQEQFNQWPSSFYIEKTPGIFTDCMHFQWHSSRDPDGNEITYTVKYSTNKTYPDSSTVSFGGITDTSLLVTEMPPNGVYYWNVTASDGDHVVEGFDNWNMMTVKPGGALPEVISQDLYLKRADSPFTASGEVVVESGACLTIDAGCEVRIPAGSRIVIKGSIVLTGEQGNPVLLRSDLTDESWLGLSFQDAASRSVLTHVIIEGVETDDGNAVCLYESNLSFNNVTIDKKWGGIVVHGGSSQFLECSAGPISIHGGATLIERCRFADMGKAIYFSRADDSVIRDCVLEDIQWDGIELYNSQNVEICGNQIAQCGARGIKMNNLSVAFLNRNLIRDCSTGLELEGGSSAVIDHNTFFENTFALFSDGQDHFEVVNSLFVNSDYTIPTDQQDDVSMSYSLCDDMEFPGEGNITGDPLLVSPYSGVFHLLANSPCIDAGLPESALDQDGTRTDIGAYSYNSTFQDYIVINEINYHSSDTHNTGDWIEIYNKQDVVVDISGWQFMDEKDDHVFVVSDGVKIEANGYWVFCNDRYAFELFHDDVENVSGEFGFGLSNGGETLRLCNVSLDLVDSVSYDDGGDWPEEADGQGFSLELIDPLASNDDPENWGASRNHFGTPGIVNSLMDDSTHTSSVERMMLYQNFPNPFNHKSTIRFDVDQSGLVELEIFNIRGQRVFSIQSSFDAGRHQMVWDASKTASGIYLCRMKFQNRSSATIKMLLIR
ncbi:CotH kinase family protein [bacterium]|nr:CotH kinase family protein [bacterium]